MMVDFCLKECPNARPRCWVLCKTLREIEKMGEAKNENVETVDLTLTVKLPAPYYKFLSNLGQLVGKTPEEILTEEVYCTLRSFVSCGALEGWMEEIQKKNEGLEKLAELVEDQISIT